MGKESALADSGQVGEISARVGRVRSLAILSILRDLHLSVHGLRAIEFPACHNSFSATVG